jgi:hypothetical protein
MVISSQRRADDLLSLWQLQRRLGIEAPRRALPINDNQSVDEFERDLQVIRDCLERR